MDTVFPFGFPFATGFYLFWMVFTLALHVVFMNYVLAGTAYLAVVGLRGRFPGHTHAPPPPDAARHILKDWMPVMVSGAITAGVGPLLFVQILYKNGFYTANLLLFNWFVAIVPVLIVGYYALYLLKSGWLHRRPGWVIAAAATVPFLCVAFTGYTWTENHLLSVRTPAEWGVLYASGTAPYSEPQLIPRLLVWAFGSMPTLAVMLGGQLWYYERRGKIPTAPGEARAIIRLAIVGLALVGVAAAAWALAAGPVIRDMFVGRMALPYFILAAAGIGVQVIAWGASLTSDRLDGRRLLAAAIGVGMTLVGMTVCRECVRIETLGADRMGKLLAYHARAAEVRGFWVFAAFLVVNTGLMGLVYYLVRTQHRPLAEAPTRSTEHSS